MTEVDISLEKRHETVLDKVGNTPLLEISHATQGYVHPGVEVLAKAEWYNPGGSVKARAASNMIRQGEKSGALSRNKIIIDASSGNTGIAYSIFGALLGYRVQLAVPANVSSERKQVLKLFGAEVMYTDPLEGTDGAQQYVRKLVSENPDKYFYPDQYNNPANWQAHYDTTALEIYEQTRGKITHFVAGLGTTGTFVGTSRRLKELNTSIKCISFIPDSPMHGLEGLKHLPTTIVPGIYDRKLADENLEVSTEDAHAMVRHIARTEGLLVGPSSAAALVACICVAKPLAEGVIVTVFCDDVMKYLSERFWEE